LAYTRYYFTARLLCTNPLSVHSPGYLHCPTWCNTIARLLGSIRLFLRTLGCMLCTIGSQQKQSPEEGIPEGGPIPLHRDTTIGSQQKQSPEEGIPEGGPIPLHRDTTNIGNHNIALTLNPSSPWRKWGRAGGWATSFPQTHLYRGRNPSVGWPLQDMCLYIPGLCTSQFYYRHETPSLFYPPVFCPHTISRNVWFPVDPTLVCQASYNIGNGNIV